jgi:O-acetyl-ADP-ribose deacetylase (regulator of RNase III)
MVYGNIVKMNVNVIVNAANNNLQQGGGVCGTIFKAAGAKMLQKECNRYRHCDTGNAVITCGGKLRAKYIIHTVGSVYTGKSDGGCDDLLKSCYTKSLELAKLNGCKSIAFPIISAGIFGYPIEKVVEIAVRAIREFLVGNDMEVYLVFYKKSEFRRFGDVLLYT